MSKLKLTDVEWEEFLFPDIFPEIFIAKSSDSNALSEGEVPFIGRSSVNNGFQGLYHVSKDKIVKKNCITVSMVGEPRSFYQPYDFTCSQNILVLRNDFLNKDISKFLISIIDNYLTSKGFGYGYPVGLNRVIKNKLMLPIDSHGQPNWQFMEDYIKQEQQQQAQQVIDYYERKLVDLAGEVVGLDKVEWKTFCLGEVFDLITKGSKGLNHLEKGISDGISYVGATNRNNGVLDFVEQKESLIYSGNAIAFIRNGEGSMGYSVYKKEDFIASQDITVGYNENLNEYNAKFITTVADQVRGKYNFGYKRNQERLKRETLTLPADQNGNPDFQYMSDFVKKLELGKVQEVLIYIYIYIKLKTILEEKVCEISWQDFWIEDVCEIISGKDIYERDRMSGEIPYITATANQNGIGYFVNNQNNTLEAGCLSVNRNGSVGYAFYHPYKALYGNDTRKLKLKFSDKYIGLFISNVITGQRKKYGYGYKMGTGRLKRQKIMLPVTEAGLPDYDYMKSYMQKQELEQIFKILNYLYKNK